jgi:hypothetical protein
MPALKARFICGAFSSIIEAMLQSLSKVILHITNAMCGISTEVVRLNRAFSACSQCDFNPGAMPQVGMTPRL